jgi:hypothetical protein
LTAKCDETIDGYRREWYETYAGFDSDGGIRFLGSGSLKEEMREQRRGVENARKSA